ncbi:MAG: HXXEE domain-containing protein [Pseudomonadota bacterium]
MADPAGIAAAFLDRVAHHWVYGGAAMVPVLLVLAALLDLGAAALAVFLVLPLYMIHQVEEHDADRFRTYVNEMVGPDRTGLSPANVAVINIVFVWFFVAASLWLHVAVSPAWGLLAGYLALINGFVHLAPSVVRGSYNPGLVTAVVLLIPIGISVVALVPGPGLVGHLASAGVVVLLHIGIVVLALRRRVAA